MPRKWATHWPLPEGALAENEREALIHTLGNLTLLNGKLNAKQSNGPWLGDDGKMAGLKAHDVLFLNKQIVEHFSHDWTNNAVRTRTEQLVTAIVQIWPVPPGHKANVSRERPRHGHKVHLADLISAGLIKPGITLVPRQKQFAHRAVTLLSDGRLDFEGTIYETPSEAAKAVRNGRGKNGWAFFLTDSHTKQTLRDVRQDYFESFAVDPDEDDDGEEDDDG